MSNKVLAVVMAAAIALAAFGAGYFVGDGSSKAYAIYTGDCYTGSSTVSCMVGNVGWGARGDVNWVDANGVGKGGPNDPGEWPSCLPPLSESKGVRFAGAWLPAGVDGSEATIVWVDCRGR